MTSKSILKRLAVQSGFDLNSINLDFLAKLADLVSANAITSMQTEQEQKIKDLETEIYMLKLVRTLNQSEKDKLNKDAVQFLGERVIELQEKLDTVTSMQTEQPAVATVVGFEDEDGNIPVKWHDTPNVGDELYTHPAPVTSMQATIDAMTETAKDASNRAISDHNEITKLKDALEKINNLRSSTLNYGVARAIECEALGIEHTDSKHKPGWVSVPPEPTEEMKEAGWTAYRDSNKTAPYNMLTDAYKAMIAISQDKGESV